MALPIAAGTDDAELADRLATKLCGGEIGLPDRDRRDVGHVRTLGDTGDADMI
jgi:hypothetical protein